jgi:hypothetical protein
MSSPLEIESLQAALAAAEAALASKDPAGAEAAVRAGLEACQALAAAGRAPTSTQLAALSAAHARLLTRALEARGALDTALEQTGRSLRAATAYGQR